MRANTVVVKPFNISEVKVIALKGDKGFPNQSQVNAAVTEYFEEHPEQMIPTDGTYPNMTVGQLTSDIYKEDQEPYNYRSASIDATQAYDEIHGGTVVWNQLAQSTAATATKSDITWTNNGDGTWTANGTATADNYVDSAPAFQVPIDHVCFIGGCPSGGSQSTYFAQDGYRAAGYSGDFGSGRIYKKTVANTIYRMWVKNGVTVNNIVFKPQFFDLTLMFGTTIADYIYSLEQATTGAGVAYFRSLFPKAYYAYNAGELMSVKTSGKKITGFNQLNEQWTSGTINSTTGAEQTDGVRWRSDFIRVFPSTTYYHNVIIQLFYFTEDKVFIEARGGGALTAREFTTPSNAGYLRAVVTTAVKDAGSICINFSSSRNGQYEPYASTTYPLSNTDLRGLFKLDASNKLYCDGDTYKSDGTVTRRYIVETYDGTEGWEKSGIYNGSFYLNTSRDNSYAYNNYLAMCNMATFVHPLDATNYVNGTFSFDGISYANFNVFIMPSGTTLDQWKAQLATWYANGTPLQLLYAVATPTTESTDPYTNPQIVYEDGTEEYIDTRTVAIPVGHLTKYPLDLKGALNEMVGSVPTTDGTYTLRVIVSNGTPTYSWVSE